MDTRRGSGPELDAMNPIGVFDTKLAAVIVLRLFEEEGGGEIGVNPDRSVGGLADGIVDMGAKGLSPGISIERGRENFRGKCGAEETWTLVEGPKDEFADFPGDGVPFRNLEIVF